MKPVTNLCLHERNVAAGDEWSDNDPGWKVVLVSKGNFYWIGASSAQLNTGEVIVIGPSTRGVLRASRIGDSVIHYFSFSAETLAGLLSLVERMSLEGAAAEAVVRIFPASDPIATEFSELVEKDTRRRTLFQRCRILNLIGMIFGETVPLSTAPGTQNVITSQLRFEQVIERIPDSDLMEYPAEKLAELCGCSPRHFRRLFRKYFKTSIRAKQTELRLEKARRLLAETDEKIVNVAIESGYRHLGFFNAMFKRKFGVTPGEWRRADAARAALREAEHC